MTLVQYFLFFVMGAGAFAQGATPYPRDYFRSPLDIPLYLSGNFGELRSNHFHAGLDFKTLQKEGFNVYAAADGYVSRIKISPYGYGKALYIDHPNGYTTVYGHLSIATGEIQALIHKTQYEQQLCDIEIFPTPDQLPVKKGDLIALSGNTGSSGGPHLHFEVRDTQSEKIINPMFFGFDLLVTDTRPPVIAGLMAYPLGADATVNQTRQPLMINLSLQKDGSYIADRIEASGKIGFAINTYDQTDRNYTKTGVFKVQSYNNGSEVFGYEFKSFAFDESRYVNALLDYPRFKRTGMRLQRLFMPSPYGLSLIESTNSAGIIDVVPNLSDMYRIEVFDFNGNKTSINVPIDYSPVPPETLPLAVKTTPYLLKANRDNLYEKDQYSVSVPANTFYEDFYLDFDVREGVLYFHNDSVPVHRNFMVSVTHPGIPEADRDKTFIASVDGNKRGYNATKRKGDVYTTYTKDLGGFVLTIDTVAPVIKALNFKQGKWISKNKTLSLSVRDNLSGVNTYNGYLNGKWVLFEYDYKNRAISYDFNENRSVEGRNDLKVVVTDNVGNSAIFETWFFRGANP